MVTLNFITHSGRSLLTEVGLGPTVAKKYDSCMITSNAFLVCIHHVCTLYAFHVKLGLQVVISYFQDLAHFQIGEHL